MNLERLTILALWLEAGAPHEGKVKGFDIQVGVQIEQGDTPECGAVCCIAGAATQFFNDEDGELLEEAYQEMLNRDGSGEAMWWTVEQEATKLLGLDRWDASKLFVPPRTNLPMMVRDSFTGEQIANPEYRAWAEYKDPQLAAQVIRNFIATGVVNWDL